jgi:uncharacterized oxidoreductase
LHRTTKNKVQKYKMEIKGKTILITGGSAGIGLEATRQFLNKGAKVIITGRNQAKLAQAQILYPSIIVIKSDVGNAEESALLYDKVTKLGGIDILYNNAGVGTEPLSLANANPRHYEDAAYEINVNYLGIIRLTDLFLDQLKSRDNGAIINTTSILSYVPALLAPTYSASKAALRFYTESLRQHLKVADATVKVFELLPPLVDTDMTAGFNEPKLSPEKLINALINGISNDNYTIRVGATKAIYLLNRLFPKLAFSLLNARKLNKLLQ